MASPVVDTSGAGRIRLLQLIRPRGEAPVNAEPGDKVRLKAVPHVGVRGVVESLDGGKLVLRLDDSGQAVRASPEEVTNYSLAARKAWQTEPHRAVGRHKGTRLCDRVSVTLRIDRDLWARFL